MRIVSADITGSVIVNGVDVTDALTSTSENSGSISQKLDSLQSSTSSLNSFTSSINTTIKDYINSETVISGSVQVLITGTTGYSTFSSSISTSIGSLSSSVATTTSDLSSSIGSLSGSVATTTSNLSSSVGSLSSSVATTTLGLSSSIGSLSGSIATTTLNLSSSFSSSIDSLSGSVSTTTSNLSSSIGSLSSSVATTTSGLASRIGSVESKTGSYATTGSNIFVGNQVITGSFNQLGEMCVTGNITSTGQIVAQTINVQQVTSSIVYSCGSNTFGCSLTNNQVFTGSMLITGSNIDAKVNNACFQGNVCVGGDLSVGGADTYLGSLNINAELTGGPSSLITFKPKCDQSLNTSYDFNINPSGGGYGRFTITNTDPGINQVMLNLGAASLSGDSYINSPQNAVQLRTGNNTRLNITSTGIVTFSCQICTPTTIGGDGYFTSLQSCNSSDPSIEFYRNTCNNSVGIGRLYWYGLNSSYTKTLYSYIQTGIENCGASTFCSRLEFFTACNGSVNRSFMINGIGVGCFASTVCSPSFVGGTLSGAKLQINCTNTWGDQTNESINIVNSGTGGNINIQHNMGAISWYSGAVLTSAITAWRNTPSSGNFVDLAFATSTAGTQIERMRIMSNGCVGIGNSNPNTILHTTIQTCWSTNGTVANSYPVATFSQCDCSGGARGLQIGVPTGGISSPVFLKVVNTGARFSILNESNVENFTISGDRVGIQNCSPAATLHVGGTAGDTAIFICSTCKTSNPTFLRLIGVNSNDATTQMQIVHRGNHSSGGFADRIDFSVNNGTAWCERVIRLDFNGNVGMCEGSLSVLNNISSTNLSASNLNLTSTTTLGGTGGASSEGFKKFINFGSAFDNPTVNVICVGNPLNSATIIRVTVFTTGFGSNTANVHTGYAMKSWTASYACPMTIVAGFGSSNVGTLAWSGDYLQYTANRVSNYDSYHLEVEYGGSNGSMNAVFPS